MFTRHKIQMCKMGRVYSDNQEIDWKLQEVKLDSNLLFCNKKNQK